MNTSFNNYPNLFDNDDNNTDLFHGLNVIDNNNNNKNNNAYFYTNNNDFFYDNNQQQQQMMNIMNMIPPLTTTTTTTTTTMDLLDYDYFNHHQQQQYNWLYDPIDSFLSPQQYCDDATTLVNQLMMNQDSIMMDDLENENITTVQGGMSRGYVSLSDVNSFVAKADSIKHSTTSFLQQHQFSCSESTTNEDSEEEDDDDEEEQEEDDDYSDNEHCWPILNTSFSTPTTTGNKLMIKIKKPSCSNALPSPYGEQQQQQWGDLISLKSSKSANTNSSNNKKYRKSMSNIFNNKKKNNTNTTPKRRGSAPHSLHSSCSLSSLSNNLQLSMRVSDSMNSFLSEDEDEDDEEYQNKSCSTTTNTNLQQLTKKGRNVDKACNHCKRSHLRCDDMRPCRRCVSTGKQGCKDVQHKPRGRPKLHKK